MVDRYATDVLTTDWRAPKNGRAVPAPAELGAVVEEVQTDFVGEIVAVDRQLNTVTLEDRRMRRKTFELGPGFLLEGRPVILTAPIPKSAQSQQGPKRTASGSIAVEGAKARVARQSRIFVEGRHDAELVEKVWGDDLRIEGVVVELLDGVDNLVDRLREFGPGPGRRVGVLVDHLVSGSKEERIAAEARRCGPTGTVLVLGHPYVDVWQAVRPERLGYPYYLRRKWAETTRHPPTRQARSLRKATDSAL